MVAPLSTRMVGKVQISEYVYLILHLYYGEIYAGLLNDDALAIHLIGLHNKRDADPVLNK